MKIEIQIPDELFREAKTMAALRGESLTDFFTEALRERVAAANSSPRGWRSVFGQARREEVEPIDAMIAEEFGQIHRHGYSDD